jgi:hypothetical protein
MKKKHLLMMLVAVVGLSSCTALMQMAALAKCDFKIDSVKQTHLAGLPIQGLRSFKDLKITDIPKVVAAFSSGKLPLDFVLNVAVRNPNATDASMTRMDWEAMIDQTSILAGAVTQPLKVPANGGIATLPLAISVNLKQIFGTLSKDQIMDVGFGMADPQDKPTRVALKLKPTIDIAGRPVTYPGWFTVKRDFTAGS